MTELVKYEAACRAVAEAIAVDEVRDILDQAEAMRHAARIAGDRRLEINAAQLRFRAERRLGELIRAQKETVGLNRGAAGIGKAASAVPDGYSTQPPTLKEAGIDRKLSSRAQRMANLPAETFETRLQQHAAEMESGAGRVAMDLLKVNSEAEQRQARRELAIALSDAAAELPTGRKYAVIYADPPWHRDGGVTSRSYENHYPTMSWSEICALPVAELALPDAWLFLWIPRAHLFAWHELELPDLETGELRRQRMPLAAAVALSWGFDGYSTAFVWTKTDEDHPDEAGGAILVRDQDELLLMFKRGNGLPKPAPNEKFGSNHRERSRPLGHSAKPQHYRRMIATMAGAGVPVLEMFARFDPDRPAPAGWDLWGNQAASDAVEKINAIGEAERGSAATPAGASSHSEAPALVSSEEVLPCADSEEAPAACSASPAAAPLEIGELDALKAFSNFSHPRRAEVVAALGADYHARGLAIVGNAGEWILRDAGRARLRELEDAARGIQPRIELTRPEDPSFPDLPLFLLRAPEQPELGLVVPARVDTIDDHIQTRLPVNAIELEEALALQMIAAGGVPDGKMVSHLVGKSWAHCTATRVLLTEEGDAALASWVSVAPAMEARAT